MSGGGADEGAGQSRPCEGVQNRLHGERLGRGDLSFRQRLPASVSPSVSWELWGGGGRADSQESTLSDLEKKDQSRDK